MTDMTPLWKSWLENLKKYNPAVISDPKGKPFCSHCGRDHKTEDKKTLEAIGITEEHGNPNQKQVMVSGTGGGNKPSCPSCGHRPKKKSFFEFMSKKY